MKKTTLVICCLLAVNLVFSQAVDWASFYGGATGSAEQGNAVAVSPDGFIYIGGSTGSTDFPDALNSSSGGTDAVLIKMDTSGNQIWALHIGGSATDIIRDVAVVNDSTIVVVGSTTSSDFPTSADAFSVVNSGFDDAFVSVISDLGSIINSSYFGGGFADGAEGVEIDGTDIYVTGHTASTDLPTVDPYQASNAGGTDGFLAKWDLDLTTLEWSTYLGGTAGDYPRKITIDNSGDVYIGGRTQSATLDLTSGAFQETNAGGTYDAYIQKIDDAGTLLWSTFYGGADDDRCHDIDNDGEAIYFTGETFSADFPSTPGAFQPTIGSAGQVDAFLVKMDLDGNQNWSTFYGTTAIDRSYRLTVDPNANITFCGFSSSFTFPTTTDAAQGSMGGIYDGVVVKMDSTGAQIYSSYLGGSNIDNLFGITDFNGDIYITGSTRSTDFPVTSGAYQTTHAGGIEDFSITRIGFDLECVVLSTATATNPSCFGDVDGVATVTVTFGDSPYTYQWDSAAGFQTTASATGLGDGTYTVIVTDGSGCTDTQTVVLTEPDEMVVNLISTSPDAGGCEGTAGVSVTGGTAPYIYNWDAGADFQTTAVVTNLCEGTACVIVVDANGCSDDTCATIESIANLEEFELGLKVFPNPVTDDLMVLTNANSAMLELYDLSMKKILSQKVVSSSSKLNMSNLPRGTYFLKLQSESKSVVRKIVKL